MTFFSQTENFSANRDSPTGLYSKKLQNNDFEHRNIHTCINELRNTPKNAQFTVR